MASPRAWFDRAVQLFYNEWDRKVAFQDFSTEHGGFLSPHGTHQRGMDLDIQLIHQDSDQQCNMPPYVNYLNESTYDQMRTRQLIWKLFQAAGAVSPNSGWIERIIFNDPHTIQLVSSEFPAVRCAAPIRT
jgi:hypothetical protein